MDDKLNKILKASEFLFLKYGIRSITMDDVCREVGISKKHYINLSETRMN